MDAEEQTLQVYDFTTGSASGFELLTMDADNNPVYGQPAALTALLDEFTVQLNVTWIEPASFDPGDPVPTPSLLRCDGDHELRSFCQLLVLFVQR